LCWISTNRRMVWWLDLPPRAVDLGFDLHVESDQKTSNSWNSQLLCLTFSIKREYRQGEYNTASSRVFGQGTYRDCLYLLSG